MEKIPRPFPSKKNNAWECWKTNIKKNILIPLDIRKLHTEKKSQLKDVIPSPKVLKIKKKLQQSPPTKKRHVTKLPKKKSQRKDGIPSPKVLKK